MRARIQSHGLGGVPSRHYDRHDYMPEKRAALEAWAAHLALARAGELGKVVPIRSARAQAQ
ncbi:MAG: hypothetical protein RML56_07825 [Burkholderiales bacterium]|nr:hypothetical protein [Burkholderiales bacterium]